MFMTTNPALPQWRYQVIRTVVGGAYPCIGAPGFSYIDNGYQCALSEIEYQATRLGADAVIGVRIIAADEFYVLVSGTAIWLDAQQPYLPQPKQETERSRWGLGTMWDFVVERTRDL
jgi:hypothetical protein